MNDMKFNLKKFKLNNISPHSIITIIGPRMTGKSTLVRNLVNEYPSIISPNIKAFSGTERVCPFYAEIATDVRSSYDEGDLKSDDSIFDKEIDTILIFDDILMDTERTKTLEIRALFMNGRHYNTTFINTMQYPFRIPPVLRTNIDYTFIFKNTRSTALDKITFECYANIFPSFEILCECMDSLDKYECLVIDNNGDGDWKDNIYWYKTETAFWTQQELQTAIGGNDMETVKKILPTIDVNTVDNSGQTILDYVNPSDKEMVKLLKKVTKPKQHQVNKKYVDDFLLLKIPSTFIGKMIKSGLCDEYKLTTELIGETYGFDYYLVKDLSFNKRQELLRSIVFVDKDVNKKPFTISYDYYEPLSKFGFIVSININQEKKYNIRD